MEDLSFGVDNTYYLWGFYGALDANGNMLMPGQNNNPGFLGNTQVKIFMAFASQIKLITGIAVCLFGLMI